MDDGENRTGVQLRVAAAACQSDQRSGAVPPDYKKTALFAGRSSNVDMALTQNAQAKTRLFKSGSKYLITLLFLVAGTGFEPVTFRL